MNVLLPVHKGKSSDIIGHVQVNFEDSYLNGCYNKIYKGTWQQYQQISTDNGKENEKENETVAVRIHKTDMSNFDQSLLRFMKEIDIHELVPDSESIIKYYGWGQYENTYFMILQYIEHDMIYMLEHDLLSDPQRISATLDVLNTMKIFHDLGLRCNDIKLENMLYADGHVKLCDFDQQAFTIIYSPPERFKEGGLFVDKHSDIWAFGIFLYILWNVAVPYQDITNPDKPDHQIIHRNLIDGYRFDTSNMPKKVANICLKCLTFAYYRRPSIDWLIEQFSNMNNFKNILNGFK